jgi:single-strand DNA-binding protein
MNDTYITIVGNVVDEPRLRTTSSSGVPVLSFRVASTSRRLDRETGKWQDSDRLFATVTCWRALAQNVARSLKKGQPVIGYRPVLLSGVHDQGRDVPGELRGRRCCDRA